MTYFITFEGPEGSGKTTIIKQVYEALNVSYDVLSTREPGGIPISEKIRDVVLGNNDNMDSRTEALLFAASRRQHLVEKVMPALNRGKLVLCDRFVDSSLAYQGYARGLGIDDIMSINQFAIKGRMPDLTIYLRLEADIGLRRIADNKRDANRLDKESADFHNKVVAGYDTLSEMDPERIKVIDANQDVNDVVRDTLAQLNKFLNKR